MAAVMNTPEKCPEASSDLAMAEEITPEKCVEAGKDVKDATRLGKKPLVPFFAFLAENKRKIMADHGVHNREVPKKAKELFDALPAEERQAYDQKFHEQKKAYAAFMATEEGQQMAKDRKEQKAKDRNENKKALMKCRSFIKKALADKKCPVQKPMTPVWQFLNEKRSEIMKEYGMKSVTQVGSKAKELFDALSVEERKVYEDRYQEQKKVFDDFKTSPEGKQYFAEVREVKASFNKELKKKELEKKEEEKAKKAEEKANALKRKEGIKKAKAKGNQKKPPPTAFQQFLEERRASIMAEHCLKGAAEVQKKAQELFDALPAQERSIYETRYEKQKEAFDQLKEIEKKALKDYKASVREAAKVPKEPKPPRKRAVATKPMPKAPKKAKSNAEEEVTASPVVSAKAADMGLADSGVSYVRLLEKLLATPGFQGNVSEEKALAVLKKNGGNLNLSRNELKSEA